MSGTKTSVNFVRWFCPLLRCAKPHGYVCKTVQECEAWSSGECAAEALAVPCWARSRRYEVIPYEVIPYDKPTCLPRAGGGSC